MKTKDSVAGRTLQKARFFLAQAEEAGVSKRDAFIYNLEAAIVFGRSIPKHLAKQYTKCDRAWCKPQLDVLEKEPLVDFLRETRNFILKEGPLGVRRVLEISPGGGGLILSGSAIVQVVRGTPWYKRSPRILWQDFSRAIFEPIRRRRETSRERRRVAMLRRQIEQKGTISKDEMYFDTADLAWKDRPAVQLVHEYLDRLTIFVDTFEARFGTMKDGEQ